MAITRLLVKCKEISRIVIFFFISTILDSFGDIPHLAWNIDGWIWIAKGRIFKIGESGLEVRIGAKAVKQL